MPRFLLAVVLLAAALPLAGCTEGYDAAMESAAAQSTPEGNETPAEGSSQVAATTPDAQPAPEAQPDKPADVNSSGPVGKILLAPSDAID